MRVYVYMLVWVTTRYRTNAATISVCTKYTSPPPQHHQKRKTQTHALETNSWVDLPTVHE